MDRLPAQGLMNHEEGRNFLLRLGNALDVAHTPFFLMQGTALGAVRDGGFTPTERDIDVGILMEHFQAPLLLRRLCEAGFQVSTQNRNRNGLTHTIVCWFGNVHADVVGWLRWGDERFACAPNDVDPHYCIVHPALLIERLESLSLFGRQWFVPSPHEDYFTREYGPDWRTPRDDHVSRARVYGHLESLQ